MRKLSVLLGAALISMAAMGTAQADDDLIKKGKKVFNKCKACHAVGPDAKNKLGPVLNGVIGRKIASYEGFNYSDALKAKGAELGEWDESKLAEFLKKPSDYVPGNKMAFGGLRKDSQIEAIIAFLKDAKDN